MDNCSGRPVVIYSFNNQNLVSYQENFHAKGHVPFVIYFDFETTAPTDNCLDPEQTKIFVVCYVTIVAFRLVSKLDRIIILRCFTYTIEQLTTLDYFSREEITFTDPSLIKMLNDMTSEVSKRRCKNRIRQKCFLFKKSLLKWFNQKFKRQFDKINPALSMKHFNIAFTVKFLYFVSFKF